MNRSKSGFTLVETLIVLVISALLLSLSLMMTHHLSFNQFRDFFFWKRFQNQFELSENTARHQRTKIIVNFPLHGPVTFRAPSDKSFKERKIMPPRNLRIIKANKVVIRDTGYIDPNTVNWQLNDQEPVYQKFQLGWGMYNIDYQST